MLANNPYFPPFSKQEYERRHRMIREAMEARGLDCLVVFGGGAHGHGTDRGGSNALFLSNYINDICYVVFPLKGDPTLAIGVHLHLENAREIGVIADVRAGFFVQAIVGERLKELRLEKGKIGLVSSGLGFGSLTMPYEHHQHLKITLSEAKIEDVSQWYQNLLLVKSDEEIKVMEKAGDLTAHAYEHMILSTRLGSRHSDIRGAVESLMGPLGATYAMMHVGSTPMSNPNMHYPDVIPTNRTVEDGHVVMTELPVGLGAYSCKIMGTYFVGEPNKLYRDLFGVAAEIYERGMSELKPGMTGRDTKKFLEPLKKFGFTMHGPLVMGWSNYLHAPIVGVPEGSPGEAIEKAAGFLDFVFKPGHCIYVVGRASTADMKAGVWVGASCVFTEKGLKTLVKHEVSKLRMI